MSPAFSNTARLPGPEALGTCDSAEDIKSWLREGANIDQEDGSGFTALLYAMNGPIGIIRLLIDNHANVNHQCHTGSTPLIWAANRERTEVVELLIDNGAEVNIGDEHGFTPLMRSAMEGDLETGRLLVERGAAIEQEDKQGRTAAHWAGFNRHPEFAEMLAEVLEGRRLRAEELRLQAKEAVRRTLKAEHAQAAERQQRLKEHVIKFKLKAGP